MPTSTVMGLNPSPLFNIGTGFNDSILQSAIDSNGKILVGGGFTTFTGATQNRLIRLNSDGSKDTSFNIGTGFSNSVYSVTVQPDGKILVGGLFLTFSGTSDTRFIRLNSDGSKDTSFNIGTGFNGVPTSIKVQSDGKILTGGSFTTFTGATQNNLIRLNTDGSKDTSFNIGTGFNGTVWSLAHQSDGKLLVSGAFTIFSGSSQRGLVRLNSNGSKDPTFNIGTGFDSNVNSIQIQSDEKILAAGSFTTFTASSQNGIIRLNSDGSKDTTFNIGTGFDSGTTTLAIQPNGKILSGGNYLTYSGSSQVRLIRLNSDGSKDTTFNIGTGFNDSISSTIIQSDGRILVGGGFTTYLGQTQNKFIRINLDGSKNGPVTGTTQVGGFSVVTASTTNFLTNPNNVKFWVGPDQDLGYVIAHKTSSGNQPSPNGNFAYLGFFRSTDLTDPSFISISEYVSDFSQTFTTGTEAKTWLEDNGYWTSWTGTTTPPTSNIFTSVWQTTTPNEVITLPYRTAGTYSGTIDWGDGSVSANSFANISHTYATAGVKTIAISGVTKGFSFDNVRGSLTKIKDVTNWGNVRLSRVELNTDSGFFYGCTGLSAITATDVLSTSGITSFLDMFRNCSSLTTVNRINEWNTSNVTTMATMFSTASLFNSNIGSWDTKKVTSISFMFSDAVAFNQNLNSWNTSAFTNTYAAFNNASIYNSPLSGWNVSNVVDAGEMFIGSAFNQNINNWNVSSMTSLFRFFRDTPFNQPLSGWNVSNVIDFSEAFYGNSVFNQNINNWVTSAATDMSGMFGNGSNFNQPLSGWNTSNVLTMSYMFGNSNQFNQSIGNWNVSKVTDMSNMFSSAVAFNQNIGSWNISGVTNFTSFMSSKTAANYSATNLDAIYNGWSTKTPKSGITISFNTIKYTAAGSSGRSVLTSAPYSWSITDGGI